MADENDQSTFGRRRADRPAGDQVSSTGDAGQSPPADSGAEDALRDAVGAYLLDALPDEERRAFETFLATSPETQEELRHLAPVVTLLPALLELEPEPAASPEPAPDLRERIIAGAQAVRPAPGADAAQTPEIDAGAEAEPPTQTEDEDVEPIEQIEAAAAGTAHGPERSHTIRTTPEGTGPFELKRRPRHAQPSPAIPTPFTMIRELPAPWLAAAALAVVAVGAILWALALQGRIDSKNREIAAQEREIVSQMSEIAALRENASATSYTLSAEGGQARGTLFYSLREGIGVLYVQQLPRLAAEQVYQLWYLDAQGEAPVPGTTFRVDRNGNGFALVAEDAPTYDGIAITAEPEGGSEAPTSDIVLQGRLAGAAG